MGEELITDPLASKERVENARQPWASGGVGPDIEGLPGAAAHNGQLLAARRNASRLHGRPSRRLLRLCLCADKRRSADPARERSETRPPEPIDCFMSRPRPLQA